MQEEYLIEKMVKGKTDKEKEVELMRTIIETKEMLKIARCNFIFFDQNVKFEWFPQKHSENLGTLTT